MAERNYPLPRPESGDDPRFTFGLTVDVAEVLAAHGYPTIENGQDLVALKMALFRFLYAEPPSTGDLALWSKGGGSR